jgi:hypothetical protein
MRIVDSFSSMFHMEDDRVDIIVFGKRKKDNLLYDIFLFRTVMTDLKWSMRTTDREVKYHLTQLYKLDPPVDRLKVILYLKDAGFDLSNFYNFFSESDNRLFAHIYNAGIVEIGKVNKNRTPSYIRNGASKILIDNPRWMTKRCFIPCLLRRQHVIGRMYDVFRNAYAYMNTYIQIILEYTGYDMNTTNSLYDDIYINYDYDGYSIYRDYKTDILSESNSEYDDMPSLATISPRSYDDSINYPNTNIFKAGNRKWSYYRFYDNDSDDSDNEYIYDYREEHEMFNYHRSSDYVIC